MALKREEHEDEFTQLFMTQLYSSLTATSILSHVPFVLRDTKKISYFSFNTIDNTFSQGSD